jgi:hypothetical protein
LGSSANRVLLRILIRRAGEFTASGRLSLLAGDLGFSLLDGPDPSLKGRSTQRPLALRHTRIPTFEKAVSSCSTSRCLEEMIPVTTEVAVGGALD